MYHLKNRTVSPLFEVTRLRSVVPLVSNQLKKRLICINRFYKTDIYASTISSLRD